MLPVEAAGPSEGNPEENAVLSVGEPVSTCFSHPAVPLAIACWFPSLRTRSLLITGSLLSAAPDLDAFGYFAGVPYDAWCGHRGFTHSLAFAACVAALLTPWLAKKNGVPRRHVFAFLFAAAASHGLVDMAANGGHGIAVLWPFDGVYWRDELGYYRQVVSSQCDAR
jgi:inner membrane protein